MEHGSESLVVVLNGVPQLQYDRGKALSAGQLACLDGMDARMDTGIRLDDQWIAHPDTDARARFVAFQLVDALQRDDAGLSAACCGYLAQRLPQLRQIKAQVAEQAVAVELVFDRPYVREVPVDFVPRR